MPKQNTVLLIEDEPNLLRVNTRVLERAGYNVLPARTLRDARNLIKGVVFHAAVLDIELEDGSGLDFCRELRDLNSGFSHNPKPRKIPIVFLTALKGDEFVQAGYDAGADDYITKPFRIEHLVECLQNALAAQTDTAHKPKEEPGKIIRAGGREFRIYMEYDKYEKRECPVYPDFEKNPEYTDEDRPFALAVDEGCPNYKSAPPEGLDSDDCGGCAYFHRDEPLAIIGICMCEALKRTELSNPREE